MKLIKDVLKKNLKLIIFYLIIGITIYFLEIYSLIFFQKILDAFQFKKLTLMPLIFYGLVIIVSTILGYIDNYPQQRLKHKLYLDFKLQSLKKMKTIDYLEYQKFGTGNLLQKVEHGATALRDVYMDFWFKLFRSLIPTILFSLYFLFKTERILLPFILIGYIVVILISNILLKRLYKLKKKILTNVEFLNKFLIRGFMELVVFRTNKKYDTEIKIVNGKIENIVSGKTKIKLVHEIFFSTFELIVNILTILILAYAVLNTSLSVGAIVTIVMLLGKAYQPIAIFNVEYVDYKLNQVAIDRFVELLDLKDDPNLIEGKTIKKIKGKIEFKNVCFSYNDKKEIIKDLSFKIEPKSSVILTGESGIGKSTILKLLTGLIKPDKGKILIDGKDLSKINLNSFYDHVSYIPQESPIFDGTLRENIIFDEKVEDQRIYEVLKLVGLQNFYIKLDSGLDTELGEKGVKVSGGERQRIALARLFFDNSKIIILDEATNAIDDKTKNIVFSNILDYFKDKTILIVSHDTSIFSKTNKVIQLK